MRQYPDRSSQGAQPFGAGTGAYANVLFLAPLGAATPSERRAPVVSPVEARAREALPRDEWDTLYEAVEVRLIDIAAHAVAANEDEGRQQVQGSTHANVLECVAALQQLHATLVRERTRRVEMEDQLLALHGALARAEVDLIGTEARALRARHRVAHDPLTSLPNRSHFIAQTDAALAAPQGQALAALYLDLDEFKAINDSYGPDIGDQVLKVVAARLVRALRAEDMVCRLGGDEFACLLFNLPSREQLGQMAIALRRAVAAPMRIGMVRLHAKASIGIAMATDNGTTSATLLRSADEAMVRAKRERCGHAFADSVAETAAES